MQESHVVDLQMQPVASGHSHTQKLRMPWPMMVNRRGRQGSRSKWWLACFCGACMPVSELHIYIYIYITVVSRTLPALLRWAHPILLTNLATVHSCQCLIARFIRNQTRNVTQSYGTALSFCPGEWGNLTTENTTSFRKPFFSIDAIENWKCMNLLQLWRRKVWLIILYHAWAQNNQLHFSVTLLQ